MDSLLLLPAPKTVLMPVGNIPAADIRRLCGVERKREFEVYATKKQSYIIETKSWPYKGKFKTWFKVTNEAYITSYAVLSDNMVTIHRALRSDRTLFAPRGTKFAHDQNGLHLIRLSDGMDYHPSSEDLAAKNFAMRVRQGMAENYKRRTEIRRQERVEAKNKAERERVEKLIQRDLKNIMVNLNDSRFAGNCIEGSLSFAERKLKVPREEIIQNGHLFTVRADRLLTVANGDGERERVFAAVKAAWRRETTVTI